MPVQKWRVHLLLGKEKSRFADAIIARGVHLRGSHHVSESSQDFVLFFLRFRI